VEGALAIRPAGSDDDRKFAHGRSPITSLAHEARVLRVSNLRNTDPKRVQVDGMLGAFVGRTGVRTHHERTGGYGGKVRQRFVGHAPATE
jgi:hypothetical protein